MKLINSFLFLSYILTAQNIFAFDLIEVKGVKFPNSVAEGIAPVHSKALSPKNIEDLKGYNQLLPFVTPSPDQEEAASCMLMSLTGAVELWLHRINKAPRFIQDGNLDLSERWWMNVSNFTKYSKDIDYWFSDAALLFNSTPSALNRNYRFAKGWLIETDEDYIPTAPNAAGAVYSTRFNWVSALDKVPGPFIKLPRFDRTVLMRDKNDDPWSIGKAPADIVEQVIAALKKYQAPVQVIYNHEGYWHSVIIVGYDEKMSSYNCKSVREALAYYVAESSYAKSLGQEKRSRILAAHRDDLATAFQRNGGCNPKGMFYVRDSQYSDPSEELYVYDPSNPISARPYSKRVILREFDWLRTMANHVNVIHLKDNKLSY